MSDKYRRPPYFAEQIVRLIYNGRSSGTRIGDMGELYNSMLEDRGWAIAWLWYWQQTIISLVMRISYGLFWSLIMLKSYMITAVRNILKYKGFSTVNILGLTLAMSLCLFAIKFLLFFYSFDNFHHESDNLYIVTTDMISSDGNKYLNVNTPYPLSLSAKDNCPDVEQFANLTYSYSKNAASEDKTVHSYSVFADQGFIDMMSIETVEGNREQFLTEPNRVVITQKLSEKLFGSESPIGKVVDFDRTPNQTVTGVIREFPHNSKFHDFEAIISYPTAVSGRTPEENNQWDTFNNLMIIRPAEKHNLANTLSILNQIADSNIRSEQYRFHISALPLTEFVLSTDARGYHFGLEIPPYMIYTLVICIFTILIIACLNYINLNTAKSLTRLKEIGLRKVIGARKKEILSQFVMESVVVTFTAFLISIFLHKIIIQLYYSLHYEVPLKFNFPDLPGTYLYFLVFALLTGVLSGLFPAVFLAGLQPIDIITRFSRSPVFSRTRIKKILIGIQLSISFFFIIVTISTFSQLRYAKNFDIGLSPDNLLTVKIRPELYEPFKTVISGSPYISEISASHYPPGTGKGSSNLSAIRTGVTDSIRLYYLAVDENFMSAIDLKIIAGTGISRESGTLSKRNIVLNETAVRRFGFTDPLSAVGQTLKLKDEDCTIIGVTKDFTHRSYYDTIQPLALRYLPELFYYMSLRIPREERQSAIDFLESKWKTVAPGIVMDYQWYEKMVEEEELMAEILSKLGSFLAVNAIIIACIGLLGITMYEIEVKTREIGIRKALGADTSHIIVLFSREFVVLNSIAILVTIPFCIFLNDLAVGHVTNRAELGLIQFVSGILFMAAIGLISILSQLIKAGRIKPAEALRFE